VSVIILAPFVEVYVTVLILIIDWVVCFDDGMLPVSRYSWKALLNIPEGRVVSYQDIASHIGHPKAFRAVANAVAINPVAFLIPCHRVIAKSGKIHQYRYRSRRFRSAGNQLFGSSS